MTACIGISGSHRTGKTTLAKVLAEKQNIPFIQTQTSKIFQQYGLNPSQTLDFDKRLWIQNKVLEQSIPLWQNSCLKYSMLIFHNSIKLEAKIPFQIL